MSVSKMSLRENVLELDFIYEYILKNIKIKYYALFHPNLAKYCLVKTDQLSIILDFDVFEIRFIYKT